MIRSLQAFFLPWRAAMLMLNNTRLIKFALIPWLINCVIFIGALFGFVFLDKWLMGLLQTTFGDGWWAPVIVWTLGIILFAAFGAGLVLSFTYLANIIGGVFTEDLSRESEIILTGKQTESLEESFLSAWSRSIREEFKGIMFFMAVWLVLLLLNFIPVIGTIIFWFCSITWVMLSLAYEFISAATERRGLRFKEKRALVFNDIPRSLGLGAGILVTTLIPLVNLFFLPFAVIAGTIWVIETESEVTDMQLKN